MALNVLSSFSSTLLSIQPFQLQWASLALRLILAAIFLVHGYPKLKDLKVTAGFLASLGFKPGIFWAFMLSVTEFFGAFALLLGLFTRIAAGLLILSMLVATGMKMFKWKTPFSSQQTTGWEFDLLVIASLVALFLLGAGSVSVDTFLF